MKHFVLAGLTEFEGAWMTLVTRSALHLAEAKHVERSQYQARRRTYEAGLMMPRDSRRLQRVRKPLRIYSYDREVRAPIPIAAIQKEQSRVELL